MDKGTRIITGPYGVGKSEFCVNLAKRIADLDADGATIADLDVVNPYFRPREKAAELADAGITIMGDCLNNNTGQDLPAVSYAFLSRVRGGENVVVDLAGGKLGLNLLASAYDAIKLAPFYEFLCVVNLFRRDTSTADLMVDFVRQVNDTCKIAVTGLVNNGHMLASTTAEHVLASQQAALQAAKTLGIPLRYTMLRRDLYDEIADEIKSDDVLVYDVLTLREGWMYSNST